MALGQFLIELVVGAAADTATVEGADKLHKKYGRRGRVLGILLGLVLFIASLWLITTLTE